MKEEEYINGIGAPKEESLDILGWGVRRAGEESIRDWEDPWCPLGFVSLSEDGEVDVIWGSQYWDLYIVISGILLM